MRPPTRSESNVLALNVPFAATNACISMEKNSVPKTALLTIRSSGSRTYGEASTSAWGAVLSRDVQAE